MSLEVKHRSNHALLGVVLISSNMDFPGLAAASWPHKLHAVVVWEPEAGPSARCKTRIALNIGLGLKISSPVFTLPISRADSWGTIRLPAYSTSVLRAITFNITQNSICSFIPVKVSHV